MRLLVFAPHPDDAVLACAGLIQQAGAAVICHVTAGDGFYRGAAAWSGDVPPTQADYLAYGEQRIAECLAAARVLGVPAGEVPLLGFPDGHLPEVVTSTVPTTSPTTGVSSVPYSQAVKPGAPYTRAELLDLMSTVIEATAPDVVAYPVRTDHNADHRAVGEAARIVLEQHPTITRLSYLVHHDLYPGIGLHWGRTLRPDPDDLPAPQRVVQLTPRQERLKYQAILRNASQVLVMGWWLEAFVATDEPFSQEA